MRRGLRLRQGAHCRGARRPRRAKPRPEPVIFLLRERTGETVQKPFLFPCRKKKRFLESKEKGAPVRVEWSQIGFRRPVFTPPPSTGPVHSGLPGRNRETRWSYPTFFRRLRRWASGRGAAAWHSLYRGARHRRGKVHSIRNTLAGIPPFIPLPLLSPEKRCALSRGPLIARQTTSMAIAIL